MGTAGVNLDPGLSNRQILEQSGTLYDVEKRQIAVQTPEGYVKSPNLYATIRTDCNQILGTVGSKYRVTQNSAALQIIEAAGDQLEVQAAGCLDSGARAWFYCAVKNTENEIVRGDPHHAYVLLTTDHTGNGSMEVAFTSIRLVCTNQMAMLRSASRNAGNTLKIRHSGNIALKISQAQRVVERSLALNTSFAEEMRYLSTLSITEDETESLLRQLAPDPEKGKNPTMARNKRDDLMNHILTGAGQDMKGVRGTRYGALQGITHYATHKHDEDKDPERKLKNAWFGAGDLIAQRARSLLHRENALAA